MIMVIERGEALPCLDGSREAPLEHKPSCSYLCEP